ncbi:MAG: M48 family peptidase, partial [Erysipelotrichia bacterium]|nr:M48 family peptidase [Erysipelotrichia bacterium]
MSFQIEIEEKIITVELKNRKNIKHCYLRILKENLIEIKANRYFTLYDAKKLIEKKSEWIKSSIKKLSKNSLNED